jgi:hypothetical protein
MRKHWLEHQFLQGGFRTRKNMRFFYAHSFCNLPFVVKLRQVLGVVENILNIDSSVFASCVQAPNTTSVVNYF